MMRLYTVGLIKAVISTFMLVLFYFHGIAQSTPWTSSGTGLPNIIPPSPEAFAIGKYGGNTIGMHTGSAIYTMPLYTISAGDYQLPVSLSYSSNGVKVDEVASRTGMQWKMDFAGVINRTVIGSPDELFSHRAPNHDVFSTEFYNFLRNVGASQTGKAFEPDQYNYAFPGYSGSFIIDNGNIIQIPRNNVKIEKTPGGFTITTPDGNLYTFGNGEEEYSISLPFNYQGNCTQQTEADITITGWYLNKINLTNGDSIKYTYQKGPITQYINNITGVNQSYTFPGSLSSSWSNMYFYQYLQPSVTTCVQQHSYTEIFLKEIQFPNGKLKLSYSSREDVSGEKKLDSLIIMGDNNIPVKKYHLGYIYGNYGSTDFDIFLSGTLVSLQSSFPSLRKRMFLEKIEDCTGADIQAFKYDYNDINALPPRLSYAQDYWGYFNGKHNNYFFPAYTLASIMSPAGSEFGGDRTADFNFGRKGVLKRITYPTGGYTDYDYEFGEGHVGALYKPKYDTLQFTGTLTPVDNLFVSDTFELNTNSTGYASKISITATADPLVINTDPNQPQVPIPDTTLHVKLDFADLDDNHDYTNNQVSVWQNFYSPVVYLPPGKCRLIVQSTYPPGVSFSIKIYNPRNDTSSQFHQMGGVRVKSIEDHDGLGNVSNKKTFNYAWYGNTAINGLPSAVANGEGMFYSQLRGMDYSTGIGYYYYLLQISSNSNYPLFMNDLSAVSYPYVTEQWIDKNNSVTGGIEHEYLVKNKTGPVVFGGNNVYDVWDYTSVVVPGVRHTNDDLYNGAELETRQFKMNGIARQYVNKTRNYYSVDNRTRFTDTLYTVRKVITRDLYSSSWKYFADFDVNRYFIHSGWMHLDSTITKQFTDNNDSMTTTRAYKYNNIAHLQPTLVDVTNSLRDTISIAYKYPADFESTSPYGEMVNRHMITPVIEETHRNKNTNKQLLYVKNNYAGSSFIKPYTIQKAIYNNTPETEITFDQYGNKGNIIQYTAKNGVKASYLWGHNDYYPVAQVHNAAVNEIFYDGFEESGTWDGMIYDAAKSHTGKNTGRIDNTGSGEIYYHSNKWLTIAATSGRKWKYSGWVYSSGPSVQLFLIMKKPGETGYASYADDISTTVTGKWVFLEKEFEVPSDVTRLNIRVDNNGGGTVWFDDIRLHPADAQMTTYTYVPLIGTTSQSDIHSNPAYYEYDDFNRLHRVRDKDQNILKQYSYKYQAVAHNNPVWQVTGNLRCKPCPANGSYITNIQQQEEKDTNPNSATYDQTRWTDNGVSSSCTVPADWQNTATAIRCKLSAGANTGEQEREQEDKNPCSSTYGQKRWIVTGTNTTACPLPVSIYAKLTYENYNYSYTDAVRADVVVRFYSNAACTIPATVSNLVLNYSIEGFNGSTTFSNDYSMTVSGSSVTLAANAELSYESGSTFRFKDYYIIDGAYIVVFD